MARDRIGWWKIGCLGVIVVPLLLAGIAIALVRIDTAGRTTTERELVQAVPVRSTAGIPGNAGSDTAPGPTAAAAPGKVVIDLAGVELYVKAAPAGSPISVQAVYDEKACELVETFEPDAGAGWRYSLQFRRPFDSFLGAMAMLFGGAYPQLVISLPVDTPMALDLKLAQGGGVVELGELWLTTVDLELLQGGLELRVSEPLARPLERFSLSGNMSGYEISMLGNASPRAVDVRQRMGGMDVDLRGDWLQDSKIAVAVEMGGGALQLPDNVVIRGLGDYGSASSGEVTQDLPALTIATQAKMGNIEVLR